MKILLALFLMSFPLIAGEFTVQHDLVYAKELKLDLYQPTAIKSPTPLIIWVHGGAWSGGTKKEMPLTDLLEKGVAIASVDYRLSGTAPFPANVHDLKAAVRYLRANAAKWNCDPSRFIIAGASAGGHLAALTGLSHGDAELEGKVGDFLDTSSDVQGIISFYGASDLTQILAQSTASGRKMREPALTRLLGGPIAEKAELARLASPIFHLDVKDPPILLFHGDRDPQMPYQQSLDLHAACKVMSLNCQFITIGGGVHGGAEFFKNDRLGEVLGFVEKVGPGSQVSK